MDEKKLADVNQVRTFLPDHLIRLDGRSGVQIEFFVSSLKCSEASRRFTSHLLGLLVLLSWQY